MSCIEDIKPIEGIEFKNAVIELVSNSDGILDELGTFEGNEEVENISRNSIQAALEACTSCVNSNWTTSAESTSTINCGLLLLKTVGSSCMGEQFRTLLTPQQRKYAGKVITAIKAAMDSTFKYAEFYTVLCQGAKLPLELIWKLHQAGIMPLERFLSLILDQTHVVAAFTRSVVNLCSQDLGSISFIQDFISGILSCFVSYAFGFKFEDTLPGKNIQKICKVFLDCITQRVISGDRIKEDSQNVSKLTAFAAVWDNPLLDKAILHPFSSHTLSLILSYNPTVRVTQAILEQHKWSFRMAPMDFVMIIVKILTLLQPQEVMATLQRILEAHEVNWKSLLIVTSTFLACCKEATILLEELINMLLKEAFEKLEMDSLVSAILLARQATIEGPPVFPYYDEWFNKIFGIQSTTYANNPRTFGFLLKFLTDLVPHERAENLKVHITRPPYVVPRCRSIWTDYVALAKTRLKDLRVPAKKLETFSDSDVGRSETSFHQSEVVSQIQNDVDKAIQLYHTTQKVPTAVLEASIFRKPYYINQFLPTLLTPTLLPDVPDAKMKFIEELKRLGKIPRVLYKDYQKGCSKEKDKLLEGIVIDEIVEDDFQDPEEQLKEILNQLCQTAELSLVKEENKNLSSMTGSSLVKQLCTKLDLFMKQFPQSETNVQDVVLLQGKSRPCLKKWQTMIINIIMNSFCKLNQLLVDKEKLPRNDWDVVSVISSHPTLCPAFILYVWDRVISEDELKDGEICALSFCIQRVGQMCQSFPAVVSNEAHFNPIILPEAVFAALPVKTFQQLSYFLRVSCLFLHWAVESCQTFEDTNMAPYYVPVCLLKKFQFVAVRMCRTLRADSIWQDSSHCPVPEETVVSVFYLTSLQEWIKKNQLTMPEWLQYEVQVIPERDHFQPQERSEYLHWCIHCKYIPMSEENGGCDGSFQMASAHIFTALMPGKGETPSYCHIIVHLQELASTLMLFTKGNACDVPWLLHLFNLLLKEGCITPNEYLDVECFLHNFFRVSCSLPSFLLFGNSPTNIITPLVIDRIKEIVNEWLRKYLSASCLLPPHITAYFLKALLHTSSTSKGSHLLKNLIHECPLILASFVTHWTKLRHLIFSNESLLQRAGILGTTLKGIDHCVIWSKGELRRESLSLEQFSFETKKWIAGLAVSHYAFEDLSTLKLQNLNQEVLSYAVHFLIAKIINLKLLGESAKRSIQTTVIDGIHILFDCHRSRSLEPNTFQFSVVKGIVSPSVWLCFPPACVSLLLEAFKNFDLKSTDTDTLNLWLSSILLNFTDCCNPQFDSVGGNNCKNVCEVWGFQFLQESSEKIKDILFTLPISALKNISEDVLECCEPEMKMVIQHRLLKKLKIEK